MMGLEPTALGTTNRCSNQLSYIHHNQKFDIIYYTIKKKFFENMGKNLKILTIKKPEELKTLREKSKKVSKKKIKSEKFQKFLDELIETARNHQLPEGWTTAGLAAIQVGKPLKVFIILETETREYKTFINPEIEYIGSEKEKDIEGCLSLPDDQSEVSRHRKIEVKYTNRQGEKKKEKYEGFDARIIQHEYDHLEGKLFVDKA